MISTKISVYMEGNQCEARKISRRECWQKNPKRLVSVLAGRESTHRDTFCTFVLFKILPLFLLQFSDLSLKI